MIYRNNSFTLGCYYEIMYVHFLHRGNFCCPKREEEFVSDSGNSLVVLGHLKGVGGLTSKLYQQNIVIENI